jgi:ketosteroid isomerase-like protein
MSNVEVVQEIYGAFFRGDIPAIMDKIADKVDWDYAYRRAANPIPWLQPRDDRNGVAGFFEGLAALEFHSFAPKAFLENPNLVVVLVELEATVRETGKRIVEQDEAHIWYFNDAGKVVRFRHCADTYQQVMACSC